MRVPGATAACVVALVLAAPAAAGPLSPGRPDITFAGDGTLRRSFNLGPEVAATQVVPLRSGRLAVLTNQRSVLRLRADGRLDRSFGRRGVARAPAGQDAATALAEAPDGGLVVAGTLRNDALAVSRRLANGRLDRGFGSGGLATFETGTFLISVDLTIAPDGTAIVAAVSVRWGVPDLAARLLAFALDPAGRLVPGFGDGGVATIPFAQPVSRLGTGLVRLPDGRLRFVASTYDDDASRHAALLVGLTADGKPDAALGPSAMRQVTPAFALYEADMASDGSRFLVTETRRRGRVVVMAVTADSERDRSFGDRGTVRVTLPFAAVSGDIVTLPGGGAAISVTRLCCPRRPAVLVLRRDGRVARGFGRRGIAVVSRFPKGPAYLDDLAVDHLGRLVLGGLWGDGLSGIREDFGDDYLAMARLRLRPAPMSLPARAAVTRARVMHVPVRCRARTGCRADLSVIRGRVRGRASVRLDAGARRDVRVRLGRAAVRLAGRRVRLTATVTAAGRTEPLAVSVHLRTRASTPRTG